MKPVPTDDVLADELRVALPSAIAGYVFGSLAGELSARLMRMVGFRNVPVHDYQKLDLDIVEAIIRRDLDDFLEFSRVMLGLGTAT